MWWWCAAAFAGPVADLYAGAERFDPHQLSEANHRIAALGPSALPELLSLVGATDDAHRLDMLCEGVEHLGVHDPSIAVALRPKLSHPDWTVRSTCGEAMAATLATPLDADPLRAVALTDPNCYVRRNVAAELHEGAPCATWLAMSRGSEPCAARVGTAGLHQCPGGGAELLRIVRQTTNDEQREEALLGLTQLPPLPEGRDTYRALVDRGVYDNALVYAIELLAPLATPEDLPRLQRVVDADPFGGVSAHAHAAQKAMAALRAR